MKKLPFALILLVFCFVGADLAQTKPLKVVKYVAPKIPGAAFASMAKGEVVVTVKIDKDGKVISSKVESGNIYLRKVSENISKEWIFNTDELSKRELKIVFVYSVKIGKNKKNIPKEPTYKVKFKKPYRLEITATAYSV